MTDALLGGAAGVVIGRNIFTAPIPGSLAGLVTRAVRQFAGALPGEPEPEAGRRYADDKLCWLDIRAVGTGQPTPLSRRPCTSAWTGSSPASPATAGLPPTVTKILLPGDGQRPAAASSADIDIVIVPGEADGWRNLAAARPGD